MVKTETKLIANNARKCNQLQLKMIQYNLCAFKNQMMNNLIRMQIESTILFYIDSQSLVFIHL